MPAACTGLWSTTRRTNSEAAGSTTETRSGVFVATSVECSGEICDVFWLQATVYNRIIWLVAKWSEREKLNSLMCNFKKIIL